MSVAGILVYAETNAKARQHHVEEMVISLQDDVVESWSPRIVLEIVSWPRIW
jgi:hypothetical protein